MEGYNIFSLSKMIKLGHFPVITLDDYSRNKSSIFCEWYNNIMKSKLNLLTSLTKKQVDISIYQAEIRID